MHWRLNYYLKSSSDGAVKFVLVPDGLDPKGAFGKKWRKIQDKDELEKVLLQQNANKLSASKSSPFVSSLIVNDIGVTGDMEAADAILAGMYKPGMDILQKQDHETI